jgi:hypothetical protein
VATKVQYNPYGLFSSIRTFVLIYFLRRFLFNTIPKVLGEKPLPLMKILESFCTDEEIDLIQHPLVIR